MFRGFSEYLYLNPTLAFLLIAHFLGDFHLQSQEVSDRKATNIKYLAIHLIGVAVPLVIVVFLVPQLWWTALLILTSHGVIDYLKKDFIRFFKLSQPKGFILDQMLHLFITVYLSLQSEQIILPDWLNPLFINLFLFLVLISKPTNIAFRIFFQGFQPNDAEKMDTIPGAGATIGLLERLVMGLCLIFGQFASMGLVFTAKSIARYDKISKNPAFAEYYLIGSLFSVLMTFLAAWLCLL